MARTTIDYTYSSFEEFKEHAAHVLEKAGYKSVVEENEDVYKCGVGFLTAMKYIKIEYAAENIAHISGWVRAVAGKEMDLNGIVAVIPKKQVKKVINEIIGAKK